jgi:hypothetical protein
MCAYEAIHYPCGHTAFRVATYCHFARNHPDHGCCRPWTLKREYMIQGGVCQECADGGDTRSGAAGLDESMKGVQRH